MYIPEQVINGILSTVMQARFCFSWCWTFNNMEVCVDESSVKGWWQCKGQKYLLQHKSLQSLRAEAQIPTVVCSCREQQQWLELVSPRVSACPSWACTSSAQTEPFRWVLLPSFWLGMHLESFHLGMPSQAVAGAMPSQGGRIAATPRDRRLLDWCGGEKNRLFLYVICSDVCFIPEVPGCPLLARGLSPLHVPDGTSSQNTEIQLPDRSAGLCGCSSREDPSGVPRTASVLHLAHVFQQQWKWAEHWKVTPASGRVMVEITVRGGWHVIPSVPYLSWPWFTSLSFPVPGCSTDRAELGLSGRGWSHCWLHSSTLKFHKGVAFPPAATYEGHAGRNKDIAVDNTLPWSAGIWMSSEQMALYHFFITTPLMGMTAEII